jgi:hypothetical protein
MPPSGTAGTFTAAQLQKVVAKIDAIWADNQQHADYQANVGLLEALRKEQTAKLKFIENPQKDKVLTVLWVEDCSTGVEDCDGDGEDDCDFTGPEAEAKSTDYALDICGTVKFSIEENMFRTSELEKEEVLAIQMMARLKEMDEYLTQKAAAKLNTFAGVNQYEGGIGTVDGVTTYIEANYWTPDMFGYFGMVQTMNKLRNPFMIHGSNLYLTKWQADKNVSNPTGSADVLKINSMRNYWDLFNIDTINDPDKVSYMIAKGAVAFANKAYYPLNAPRVYQFGKRWSIESKSLPGVFYDVFYKERCVGEKIYYDFKIKVKAGVFLNPNGCNDEVTGVLKFVCGPVPAES